jgi:hypothetical protein
VRAPVAFSLLYINRERRTGKEGRRKQERKRRLGVYSATAGSSKPRPLEASSPPQKDVGKIPKKKKLVQMRER